MATGDYDMGGKEEEREERDEGRRPTTTRVVGRFRRAVEQCPGAIRAIGFGALVKPVAAMRMEFPTQLEDVQLDIVGLLAVVGSYPTSPEENTQLTPPGESAMEQHIQPITASYTCFLPRLLPAPQSFLKTERLMRLPPSTFSVVSVKSGNYSPTLNFFPSLLHGDIDSVPRHTIRTFKLTRRVPPLHHNNPKVDDGRIYVRRWGPMNILAAIGFLGLLGLIIAAAITKDGMSLIALVLLGVTSTFTGLATHWTVDLARRNTTREVPPGDVVIVGRQGAFLIVKCHEDLARELYFGPDRCKYTMGDMPFRVLSGAAMFLFMAGVVFLASGTWAMQAGIGLSYIVLNALYWLTAALIPGEKQWDLGMYDVVLQDEVTLGSYTSFLMEAIRKTGEVAWVRRGGVVPKTEAWGMWLEEAEREKGNKEWLSLIHI